MNPLESEKDSWEALRKGIGCPNCAPRGPNGESRLEISPLSISTLYLKRDQRFRGYSLLIFDRRHATSLEELDDDEYQAFMRDLKRAVTAIRLAVKPDHMNYECLGNSNPHLHWHIVPRYRNDPRWGQPIWEGWQRNEFNIHRVVLSDRDYATIIEGIRGCLRGDDGRNESA